MPERMGLFNVKTGWNGLKLMSGGLLPPSVPGQPGTEGGVGRYQTRDGEGSNRAWKAGARKFRGHTGALSGPLTTTLGAGDPLRKPGG